ncbi:Uncharacterised protein [Actinobacillus pleuropneumoniae]|nr:Uncharacterised protein [Actinobacillus pleuropneumoniae]
MDLFRFPLGKHIWFYIQMNPVESGTCRNLAVIVDHPISETEHVIKMFGEGPSWVSTQGMDRDLVLMCTLYKRLVNVRRQLTIDLQVDQIDAFFTGKIKQLFTAIPYQFRLPYPSRFF